MSGETDQEWTIGTSQEFLQRQIDDMRNLLDERDQANRRAVDAALTAATTALERAEANLSKEFHEHLVQYRHETLLAFEASDKAISKAEAAAEKRFEAMNEFRGQLSDQATTFMARAEADARIGALVEKIEAGGKLSNDRLADINRRFETMTTLASDRLVEVNRRLDLNQGGSSATYRVIGWGFAIFGVFMSVVIFAANYIFGK